LLAETASLFRQQGVPVWLEYGTLLGAFREKDIIPYENDNDIGIMAKDCGNLAPSVYAAFETAGMGIYNRSVVVPHKRHLVYDHQLKKLTMSSPYLHLPCLRIFDQIERFYVDVYSFEVVSAQRARALHQKQQILLPPGYNFEQSLVCNGEGLDPEGTTAAAVTGYDVLRLRQSFIQEGAGQ